VRVASSAQSSAANISENERAHHHASALEATRTQGRFHHFRTSSVATWTTPLLSSNSRADKSSLNSAAIRVSAFFLLAHFDPPIFHMPPYQYRER